MRKDVSLYNDRAEQFLRLKSEIEDRLGHEISDAAALGFMMAEVDDSVEGALKIS
ncbi:hypothetical protein [Haloarchaeobius sp. HRN-SO-5]|uniref:hypothetical protein n=1 Tax=Haloarchaeobius sp. HRN-SO-5 TaxID=3446118 RepID=UPI003EB962A4